MFFLNPGRTFVASLLITGLIVSLPIATPRAQAASYNVRASVPESVLTRASTFAVGLDGTLTGNASFAVNGSCQTINQATVVTIWRGTRFLGSTACVSNSFGLPVILYKGVNHLVARTTDASGRSGPDSQPITVTLQLPASNPPPASTASGSQPANPAEENSAVNAGVATNLAIHPAAPFSVLSTRKSVEIQVNVTGGSRPYVILLNWGDGSTESQRVNAIGTYHFSHTYQATTNYQVKGAVHDVMGAISQFSYAVVSYVKRSPAAASTTVPKHSDTKLAVYTTVATVGVVGGGLYVAHLGYRLGARQAAKTARSSSRGRRIVRRPRGKV